MHLHKQREQFNQPSCTHIPVFNNCLYVATLYHPLLSHLLAGLFYMKFQNLCQFIPKYFIMYLKKIRTLFPNTTTVLLTYLKKLTIS